MAGAPDDRGPPDVLDWTPKRSPRPWLVGVAVLAVLVLAAYLLTGGDDEPQARPAPTATPPMTTATPTPPTTSAGPPPPRTSAPYDPADLTTGQLPDSFGAASGQTALRAVEAVANGYCARISTWRIQLLPDVEDDFLEVRALLRPSGPAYPNVLLQIDLTWEGDHYSWATPRQPLLDCP